MILRWQWLGKSRTHADQVGTQHRHSDLRMVDAVERHRVCRFGERNNRADGLKLVYILSIYGDNEQQKANQDAK